MIFEFFYDAIMAFYVALLGLVNGLNWAQVLGTGFIAGFALFLANLGLDEYRRPKLKIKSQASPVEIDLAVFNISDPALRAEQWPARKMTVKYKVSRLKIENDGRLAAEDCKGILNDGMDRKICWNVPSERRKITINSNSFEYLDVCAVLESKKSAQGLVTELEESIKKIGQSYANVHLQSTVNEEYSKVKDWLKENNADNLFPKIIAPTEDGWKEPPHLNRHIKTGSSKITVSAKNAKPRIIDVTIKDSTDKDGKCIEIDAGKLDKTRRSPFTKQQKPKQHQEGSMA
jgi:hypothetical protein